MYLSIVSGTPGKAGNPREIDWAKSPLGQKFDRQLYPTSGEIDNPRKNWQRCHFQFPETFTLRWTKVKQYGCSKSVQFSKNLVVCSSAGPKILVSVVIALRTFNRFKIFFSPNFKLTYEDSENIKADCVSTVDFNLH